MSKKKSRGSGQPRQASRQPEESGQYVRIRKSSLALALAAIVIVGAAVAVVAMPGGSGGGTADSGGRLGALDPLYDGDSGIAADDYGYGGRAAVPGDSAAVPAEVRTIAAGEYLDIPTADIGDDAAFFPVEVDGTSMELLAVRASDGSVRTAFNTCQSCYTSGRGYYEWENGELVCQNCGFHFSPDEVGVRSGGCNPWPIFDGDRTVTEDGIRVSYDFLKESSGIFANWKL